jgi:hypothetical protein
MIDIFFELTQISRFPPSNYKITFVWLRGGKHQYAWIDALYQFKKALGGVGLYQTLCRL